MSKLAALKAAAENAKIIEQPATEPPPDWPSDEIWMPPPKIGGRLVCTSPDTILALVETAEALVGIRDEHGPPGHLYRRRRTSCAVCAALAKLETS